MPPASCVCTARCLPQDVELNAACGIRQLTLEISISELKLSAYGLDRKQVLSRMISALTRAKELDLKVAFMPVDLTRAELDFARQVHGDDVAHRLGHLL